MTRASELFLWSGSCPSSATNHFRQHSNPHKSQQLYWLPHMIYDRRGDLDSKHHQRLRISGNVALNHGHIQYVLFQKYILDPNNTTIIAFYYDFGFLSRRAWCSSHPFEQLSVGSSEGQPAGWCNVCQNQDGGHGGEVKHEEWNRGKVVLRQRDQLEGLMPCRLYCLLIYRDMNTGCFFCAVYLVFVHSTEIRFNRQQIQSQFIFFICSKINNIIVMNKFINICLCINKIASYYLLGLQYSLLVFIINCSWD